MQDEKQDKAVNPPAAAEAFTADLGGASRVTESLSEADFAAPPADPLIGRLLDGRYEVQERIGAGGMAVVYRGLQVSLQRPVAIKVLTQADSNTSATQRFLREARMASRLSHPHVVTIHGCGESNDGILFIVMELLQGPTLRQLLSCGEGLPRPRFFNIAAQLCKALSAAHGSGIVHRDLKPGNIMVSAAADSDGEEVAKVLDFGLAKPVAPSASVTISGAILGTPLYMSPEMIAGESVDGRSDLYALGCILYEMAEGRPPFQSALSHETLTMHATQPPPPIVRGDLGDVGKVVAALLEKRPTDRPADAQAVRTLLEAELGRESSQARGAHLISPQPVEKPASRWGTRVLALGGVLGVALFLGLLFIRGVGPITEAEQPSPAMTSTEAAKPGTGTATPAGPSVEPEQNSVSEGHAPRPVSVDTEPAAAVTSPVPVRRRSKPRTAAKAQPSASTSRRNSTPRSFDISGYFKQARASARRVFPDAQLIRIAAGGVRPTGNAELTLKDTFSVMYGFASRDARARVPKGMSTQTTCLYYVNVTAAEIEGYKVRDVERDCAEAERVDRPRCSVSEIWRRAIETGAPGDNTVADLVFAPGSPKPWRLRVGHLFYGEFPDDC